MRLATFAGNNGVPRLGALLPDGALADLRSADPNLPGSVRALLAAGPAALAAARAASPKDRRLLSNGNVVSAPSLTYSARLAQYASSVTSHVS